MSELHPHDGPEIRLPEPWHRYTVQHPYAWANGDDNVMLYDTREGTGVVYGAEWARVLANALLTALGVDEVALMATIRASLIVDSAPGYATVLENADDTAPYIDGEVDLAAMARAVLALLRT